MTDIFKKKESEKSEAAKTTKPSPEVKSTASRKPPAKTGSMSDAMAGAGAEAKVDAFLKKREALTEAELKK
ncbi:MAG: hypothetical protein FJZ98_01195 [Chloroflexi bacterium]|nr:hypothetical protein [Chloroflexota bacterium]